MLEQYINSNFLGVRSELLAFGTQQVLLDSSDQRLLSSPRTCSTTAPASKVNQYLKSMNQE